MSGVGGNGAGGAGEATATALRLKAKVIVIGQVAVGKTSLVNRFTTGTFNKSERPSVGVAFSQKTVSVDAHTVRFETWDTAGQERFRSVNQLYYRGAAAGVCVYDVTSRSSFNQMTTHWLSDLRKNTGDDIIIAICGNKCDLEGEREVSTREGAAFAKENGFVFVETSARTGKHVDLLFAKLAREGLKQFRDGSIDLLSASATADAGAQANGFQLIGIDRGVSIARSESGKSTGCCS